MTDLLCFVFYWNLMRQNDVTQGFFAQRSIRHLDSKENYQINWINYSSIWFCPALPITKRDVYTGGATGSKWGDNIFWMLWGQIQPTRVTLVNCVIMVTKLKELYSFGNVLGLKMFIVAWEVKGALLYLHNRPQNDIMVEGGLFDFSGYELQLLKLHT